MDNLFRVICAAQWASTVASGVVPRCPSDQRSNCVHLNFRGDVEAVANLYFNPEEAPAALELRRRDMQPDLTFSPATQAKPFRQACLARSNILLSWVVAVHRLQCVQRNGVSRFEFGGMPEQVAPT